MDMDTHWEKEYKIYDFGIHILESKLMHYVYILHIICEGRLRHLWSYLYAVALILYEPDKSQ